MATNKLNQNQTNSNKNIVLHESSTSSSTTSPIINFSDVSSQRTVDLNIFPTSAKKTKWAIQRATPVHDIPEGPFLVEPTIVDESIYYNRSSIHENNNINGFGYHFYYAKYIIHEQFYFAFKGTIS